MTIHDPQSGAAGSPQALRSLASPPSADTRIAPDTQPKDELEAKNSHVQPGRKGRRSSGDHTLGHIEPGRLARRLVIFTPTGGEIDTLMERARRDLPGLGDTEVVHRVVSHNPDSFWAIARREKFNSRERQPEGFQAYLMLNHDGLRQLVAGTFKGTDPDISLLASQHEKPAGIYIWCTHAWGALSGGMSLTLQKISTPVYRDVDVYSCASTPEGKYTLEGLGFTCGASYDGVTSDSVYKYTRSAPEPAALPIYDNYLETEAAAPSITVARTMEELSRVFSVRSAVYMAEQRCPYGEEFDGNDFSATHLLGYVGQEPAACLRIRYFANFAKLERLAVRREFRGHKLAQQMIRAGIEMCRMKGYTRIYGQSEESLVGWYGQFGFRVPNEARELSFSEFGFVEIVLDVPPHPDAVSIESDPYVIIRPEGRWHTPGVLEKSAAREVTRPGALRETA
jgi:predicted GNAT family N-acyltransferase